MKFNIFTWNIQLKLKYGFKTTFNALQPNLDVIKSQQMDFFFRFWRHAALIANIYLYQLTIIHKFSLRVKNEQNAKEKMEKQQYRTNQC